jgi:hypothetical protein
MIRQMGGDLRHPAGVARGADPTAFARESNHEVVAASPAISAAKTMGQNSAFEELAKVPLHVARDRVGIGIRLPMRGKPALQVLLHHFRPSTTPFLVNLAELYWTRIPNSVP